MESENDKESKKEQKKKEKLAVIKLSDVYDGYVQWMWYPYVPVGCITVFSGDPAAGKTYLGLYAASILSTGGAFVNSDSDKNEYKQPQTSLIINGEDQPFIIRKRIKALGGNTDNIYVEDVSKEIFHIDDVKKLEEAIKDYDLKLIIVDPVQAFLPSKVNMDSALEVRKALSPIVRLAEKYQCSIILIMHRNKNNKTKSLYRILGSIDFLASARSAISVEKENGKAFIHHIKNSLGAPAKDICMEITDNGLLFSEANYNDKKSKYEKHKKIIKDALANGNSVLATEMYEVVKKNNISSRELNKIKKELGVKSIQMFKKYYWCILDSNNLDSIELSNNDSIDDD